MRLVPGSRCNLGFSDVKIEAWNGVVLLYFRSFRCSWMTQGTWMTIWRSSWQSLTGGTIFSSQSWMSWGLCWTRLNGQGSWQSTNCWKPLNVWTCFTARLAFSVPSPSLVNLTLLCWSLTLPMAITCQTHPAIPPEGKWGRGVKSLCRCATWLQVLWNWWFIQLL